MVPPPSSRRRGGQPGNINAVKHGFYTPRIRKTGPIDLTRITHEDLQEEISALRLYIRAVLKSGKSLGLKYPQSLADLHAITQATSSVCRLVKARYMLARGATPVSALLSLVLAEAANEIQNPDDPPPAP